jgi:hypothetical protein
MIDNGPLRLDSVLEMRLKVVGITVTVPARVMQFDPPESITWQGQQFGIHATHNYRFIPRNEGTLMCNEEIFTGVGFPLSGLLSAWYRASKLSEESLHGIRRELLRTIGLAEQAPADASKKECRRRKCRSVPRVRQLRQLSPSVVLLPYRRR